MRTANGGETLAVRIARRTWERGERTASGSGVSRSRLEITCFALYWLLPVTGWLKAHARAAASINFISTIRSCINWYLYGTTPVRRNRLKMVNKMNTYDIFSLCRVTYAGRNVHGTGTELLRTLTIDFVRCNNRVRRTQHQTCVR